MASNTNEVSLDKLVGRFEKATAILKRQMTMHELATQVGISPGLLSRYRKPQLYNLSSSSYHALFENLDRLIYDKFHQKWQKELDEYDVVTEPKEISEQPRQFDDKLAGLRGEWQGFSWNKIKTAFSSKFENDTPGDYFNLFTLKISEQGQVTCVLEKTVMTGIVSFVAPKTISIDLASPHRRLVMFAQISLRDDLGLVKDITFAYVDTGDNSVKCGLAISNKIEDGVQPPIAKSFRQEDVNGISEVELKYLLGNQLIADEWGFML